MLAPCKNCEKKGCGAFHSQCDKYLKFKEECEKSNKKRQREQDIIGYRRDCC